MAWLTNKTWAPGRLLASDLNTYLRDQLDHIGGTWTDTYSPTLTASGGNPNLGSTGSAAGRAKIIGKTCKWSALFVFSGSGVSAGSGPWVVSLPATPRSASFQMLGHGYLFVTGDAFKHVEVDSTTGGARLIVHGAGAALDGASYPLLSAGTVLTLTGEYEIA